MKAQDRIIVALDVNTLSQVAKITTQLKGLVSTYKVGWQLFMSEGMSAVSWLNSYKYNIFLDLKMDDIPNTITAGVSNIPDYERLMFMTFQGDNDTYKAMKQGNPNVNYLYVPTLSTRRLQNVSESMEEYYLKDMISEVHSEGIIASGNRIKIYRETCPNSIIVSPGIRPAGSDTDGHKESGTPAEAVKQGADYLVIGRPITEAENPREVVLKIIDELEND